MKDAGATPTYRHLHDNASHTLLGKVYWQEKKAVWAGRKHFTSNISSTRTEQPVYMCVCAIVLALVCAVVYVRVAVWDTVCVGHVWACVGEQHSDPSKSPVGCPEPQEKNEPCPVHSASCSCSPATISSWFTLNGCEWVRHTSLTHNTATRIWHMQSRCWHAVSYMMQSGWRKKTGHTISVSERSFYEKQMPIVLRLFDTQLNILRVTMYRIEMCFSGLFLEHSLPPK